MKKNTRRAWIARVAAGGASLALGMARLRNALATENVTQGVARVQGEARINGEPATRGMTVKTGDVVTTGRGAQLVFVVDRDAFLVRADARIELSGRAAQFAVGTLRVVSGALLSVFASGEKRQIRTGTAVIGIRGTGIYVEIEPDRTYVCTCYGEAELVPVDDPREAETVHTRHHDQPRYIYRKGMPRMMERAPVINHTDAELTLLESLVGRRPPFEPGRY